MLDLDQIESQFRASVRVRPELVRPQIATALLITDLGPPEAQKLLGQVKGFLRTLGSEVSWSVLDHTQVSATRSVLDAIETHRPDLAVTYRHLFEDDKDLPHSLGTVADMLTQTTTTPILLLPPPGRADLEKRLANTDRVMVVTDHIVGDGSLVSWGLTLVESEGALALVHIEDDVVFARYVEAISKIPGIDTGYAERTIEKQLLHDAERFMDDVEADARAEFPKVRIKKVVRRGHTVKDYERVAEEEQADIVVFHTKDEDQLAMHGRAYSLAVELLDRPLLML